MELEDVKRKVDRAIKETKLVAKQPPKLQPDNGSCYIASDLKSYLKDELGMDKIHDRPMHPKAQGKIELYLRTIKKVVKIDHYYAPDELVKALEKFVHRYNNERYLEFLNNLTPADVY